MNFLAPHRIAANSRGDIYVGEVANTAWPLIYPDRPRPAGLRVLRKLEQSLESECKSTGTQGEKRHDCAPNTRRIRSEAEDLERARSLILENAAASLDNEGGCLRFDVLEDAAEPCLFALYEVYRSAADFDAHCKARISRVSARPHAISSFPNLSDNST